MRPIVVKTLHSLIFRALKDKDYEEHGFYALGQLIAILRTTQRQNQSLIKKNDKYVRLRHTHLHLIQKLKKQITTLEKEIDALKEEKNPTPKIKEVEKIKYCSESFEENDFARALHCGGFSIPRF